MPTSPLRGRRNVVRSGLAIGGALAGAGLFRRARAANAGRLLRLGHVYVRESQLGVGANEFARHLEAATSGAWRVQQYPHGALGGEVELVEGLRSGEVDLAFLTGVVFAGVMPEFGVFDLPFLFRDVQHARFVLDGPIGDEYLQKFRGHGLLALAWGETGMRHITNSKRPVRDPADLRGLRLRVPQSEVMLRCFRQLGAAAAPLGFPALYGALDSGAFDGQENPLATIQATHFERVQRYLTLSAHIYCSAIMFISQDCWDDLTGSDREAFAAAARAGGAASRVAAEAADREGVEALRATGMEIVPSVDRDAFRAALEPVWSDLAGQYGSRLISRIQS